ncbi:MAG TPA: hypothetical protein VF272_00285 [Candidatus Saccharimonadia bacterium]
MSATTQEDLHNRVERLETSLQKCRARIASLRGDLATAESHAVGLEKKLVEARRAALQLRINELRPVVDESERLEAALVALDKHSLTKKKRSSRSRSRERGNHAGGKRSQLALAIIQEKPGITIPEIARDMGIKSNYLYRAVPALADAGHIVKDETTKGWSPKQ